MTEQISQEVINAAVLTTNEVSSLNIDDQTTYEHAGEALVKIKRIRKELRDTFQPILDKQNAVVKETRAQYKKYDNPLSAAERQIKAGIARYVLAQERARQEEEHRLQLIAPETR